MSNLKSMFPPNSRASFNGHNGKVGWPSNSGRSVWFYPDENVTGGITIDWWQLKPELPATIMWPTPKWIPLGSPPTQSGSYIVGHRGHQEIIKFVAAENPTGNTCAGWQRDPRIFKATHWSAIAELPEHNGPREGLEDFRTGDIIVVSRNCLAGIYETHHWKTVVPVKWGPFTWNRAKTVSNDRVKTYVPVQKGAMGSVVKTRGHHDSTEIWVILNDSGREVVFNPQIGYNIRKFES